MGLFEKIFKYPDKTTSNYFETLTAYAPVFHSWNGALYESELVRSAIDARSRHISKLRVEFKGDARKTLITRIQHTPNQFQTWGQFLYRLNTILDMQNTAFIVPMFGAFGDITGYYPVLPSRCEVADVNGTPWLRYSFSNGQRGAVEFSLCGIMTKFQYENDFFGANNKALDSTMNLISIQEQGIAEAVKNSATYRFMARVNNFTKPEDLKKERERFSTENFKNEGGGLLLFPNTYGDIRQLTNTPYHVDADQKKLIQQNVYNYFGVNEDILQNKAIGDTWNAFYEGCIEVFALQFSETMTKMMFTERERSTGNMVMATSNRLQYMSNNDKLQVSAQMADRGIMTVNEIREIWNLPPVADGDVRLARGEYYEVGKEKENGVEGTGSKDSEGQTVQSNDNGSQGED